VNYICVDHRLPLRALLGNVIRKLREQVNRLRMVRGRELDTSVVLHRRRVGLRLERLMKPAETDYPDRRGQRAFGHWSGGQEAAGGKGAAVTTYDKNVGTRGRNRHIGASHKSAGVS
jgi:hypothetical protein